MQLEGEREFQNAIIREREEGIKQIEATIHEVNEIFIDLATLVQEQAPMIGIVADLLLCLCTYHSSQDNIESHIDSAVSSTSKGVAELRQAAAYQDSARTKMCCIILIVLVIVAIVVLALVLGTWSSFLQEERADIVMTVGISFGLKK
jgi:syntaxin 7